LGSSQIWQELCSNSSAIQESLHLDEKSDAEEEEDDEDPYTPHGGNTLPDGTKVHNI
jgi:hypothetical protein